MKTNLSAFATLPPDARVWVYQAQRNLNDDEVNHILPLGQNFIANWAAHGHKLDAVIDVLYHRFVILAVDQRSAAASGCSIDASVKFIRQLSENLQTDLLERLNLAFIDSTGEVSAVHANDLQAAFAKGRINPDSIVFNNMVTTVGELRENWQIPLGKSWAASRLAGAGMVI